ncbi:MAG: GLPGLI family protein [Candidatus Marinimicrobia bacterium]|nr:GLPGLI family protein [Candidatus Neomarinimicrobiota bacterium]
MKTQFIYRFAVAVMLMTAAGNLAAQEIEGGTVKYQQTTRYDFSAMFGGRDNPRANNPRMKERLASLPKESTTVKVLYFTEEEALCEDDPAANEALPRNLQHMLAIANYMKLPSPDLSKVYYNFRKNKKIEQVEFMTRDFLVSNKIERKAWKLTNKNTRILGYTCMGAELKKEDQTITAWFTSEIPFSVGPDEFIGLPGLILAVEIDGETAFLATSIDLTPPTEGLLVKPDAGKKVTRKKFDKIIAEKIKEYEETKGEDPDRRRRRRR